MVVHFSHHHNNRFGQGFVVVVVVSFLKAKSYFPLLSVKSPDSKFCLNQSSNWYGSNHHRALTWHHFSENGIISSMSVFTELWNCSKMFLWTWELGPDDKTSLLFIYLFYCSQWKLDSFSLKLARKTHRLIFLFSIATALVMILSYLK